MIELPLSRPGRVLLSSNQKDVDTLVIGFHGYGELAESQMKRMKMLTLSNPNTLLLSVQALYPFLISSGEERFSWMAKGNKGLSIQENRDSVKAIIQEFQSNFTWKHLIVCGHSQGVSTLWRTVHTEKMDDILLPFAGEIPKDVRGQKMRHFPFIFTGRRLKKSQLMYITSTHLFTPNRQRPLPFHKFRRTNLISRFMRFQQFGFIIQIARNKNFTHTFFYPLLGQP
jgi:predicted esterase